VATTAGSANVTAVAGAAATAVTTKTGTVTTLTVTTAAPAVNKPVNFAIAVRPASGTVTPTGAVTVRDGDRVVGTVSLLGGQAAFSTSGLATGTHRLIATYNGNGNFAVSTAAALTVLTASPTAPTAGQRVALSIRRRRDRREPIQASAAGPRL
jgi:hypothetical protein